MTEKPRRPEYHAAGYALTERETEWRKYADEIDTDHECIREQDREFTERLVAALRADKRFLSVLYNLLMTRVELTGPSGLSALLAKQQMGGTDTLIAEWEKRNE